MAVDPSLVVSLADLSIQSLGTQADIFTKAYDAGKYYSQYDPAKELNKAIGPLTPNAYGEIDLASVYAYKPIDYYGTTGTGKNGNPTMTERMNTASGGDGWGLTDLQTAPLNFLNSYTQKPVYNKVNKELDAYKKKLTRDAMGYNQGVATRRAYYDKLLEDQSFDYSKFYGNA